MAITARLVSGTTTPVVVEVDGHTGETGTLWLHRSGADEDPAFPPGLAVHQAWQVTEGTVRVTDDGHPDVSGTYAKPPTGVPLTYHVSVYDGEDAGDFIPVAGTPVTLTGPKWPRPRLALAATDPAPGTGDVTFTVTEGDPETTVTLDPGDGTALKATQTDADGTATFDHTYLDPGHHTYTATAAGPVTPAATTLGTLVELVPGSLEHLADTFPALDSWAREHDTATARVTTNIGPAALWATVEESPGDAPPHIRLDAWIGNPETVASWELERLGETGTVIRIGTATDATATWNDAEAPLGVPVTYRLTIRYKEAGTTASVTSQPVSIEGTRGCYLTDPISGSTMPIEVQAWDAEESAARQSVLEIIGRPDPVVLSDTHLWPSGTWVLLTRTDAATDRLRAILTASRVVLLRTQSGASMRTVYAAVGDFSAARVFQSGTDQTRLTDVKYQQVRPVPASAKSGGATLKDLHDATGTLTALAELRPNLLGLSQWTEGS